VIPGEARITAAVRQALARSQKVHA
jgi:hypothetical protein